MKGISFYFHKKKLPGFAKVSFLLKNKEVKHLEISAGLLRNQYIARSSFFPHWLKIEHSHIKNIVSFVKEIHNTIL